MQNIDSLNYAIQVANSKELAELSKSVKSLMVPEWHKYIIPFLSTIGIIVTARVGIIIFKRNKNLELEKLEIAKTIQKEIRQEDKLKEFEDTCRGIYGQLVGINHELQISVLKLCISNLDFAFQSVIEMSRETNQNAEQLREEIVQTTKKHEQYMNEFNEIYKNFISKISEYMFLNKKSELKPYLDKLQETGFQPKFSRSFANMKDGELMEIRLIREKEIQNFVYGELGAITDDILNCVYNSK